MTLPYLSKLFTVSAANALFSLVHILLVCFTVVVILMANLTSGQGTTIENYLN